MVQAQQQKHLGSAPGKDEADSNTASPWKTVRLGVQTTANFNSIKVRGRSERSVSRFLRPASSPLASTFISSHFIYSAILSHYHFPTLLYTCIFLFFNKE
ncbi:spectrin alpha chain, non-erythrocytic 1-like [Nothobranchius furzeri]|uniref:spectrin alpha chain, non-erythrocytic 1-like n=1 Tax=Nothobranchius furzeri TaxID=105023 RepID=UPI003904A5B5